MITFYQPPDCSTDSFDREINFIEVWMNEVKDIDHIKFLMTGDFNMSFLGNWNSEYISEFVHSTSNRSEKCKVIDAKKKQALRLLELTNAWGLVSCDRVQEG